MAQRVHAAIKREKEEEEQKQQKQATLDQLQGAANIEIAGRHSATVELRADAVRAAAVIEPPSLTPSSLESGYGHSIGGQTKHSRSQSEPEVVSASLKTERLHDRAHSAMTLQQYLDGNIPEDISEKIEISILSDAKTEYAKSSSCTASTTISTITGSKLDELIDLADLMIDRVQRSSAAVLSQDQSVDRLLKLDADKAARDLMWRNREQGFPSRMLDLME